MIEMQKIQPKIKALQEKYKNNKEKQQEELMKFYSENKVNPFGGCLPLLLQFPILIALYGVLGQKAGPERGGGSTVQDGIPIGSTCAATEATPSSRSISRFQSCSA